MFELYCRNEVHFCGFWRYVNAGKSLTNSQIKPEYLMLSLWVIRQRLYIDKLHKNKTHFLNFQLGIFTSNIEICAKKIVPGFLQFLHWIYQSVNLVFRLLSTNQIFLNKCKPVKSELFRLNISLLLNGVRTVPLLNK